MTRDGEPETAGLTYEQRCERYHRQNAGRAVLTARQQRRIGKKIDRAFYRSLRTEARP